MDRDDFGLIIAILIVGIGAIVASYAVIVGTAIMLSAPLAQLLIAWKF